MKISVFNSYDELSLAAAEAIITTVTDKPDAVLCLATGDTPRLTYQHVVKLARQNKVDFSDVHFISLDEWVGVPRSNTGSCYSFLSQYIFEPLAIRSHHIHFFDGLASDLSLECNRMNSVISKLNGIDLLLLGIGLNGHIGFNEPGVSSELQAHVIELDKLTLEIGQKYFSEKVNLKQGITLGLTQILDARKILMLANGEKKADVVERALTGEISTTNPASLLRTHSNSFVFLDKEASGKLIKIISQ